MVCPQDHPKISSTHAPTTTHANGRASSSSTRTSSRRRRTHFGSRARYARARPARPSENMAALLALAVAFVIFGALRCCATAARTPTGSQEPFEAAEQLGLRASVDLRRSARLADRKRLALAGGSHVRPGA